MESVDDAMNKISWLFLETLFGVQPLTWNISVLPHKLWSWSLDKINFLKRQFTIYRLKCIFQKSLVTKMIKLTNFSYPQYKFHFQNMPGKLGMQ